MTKCDRCHTEIPAKTNGVEDHAYQLECGTVHVCGGCQDVYLQGMKKIEDEYKEAKEIRRTQWAETWLKGQG